MDYCIEIYLKTGIAIYNSGEYHAAHGAWEMYWLKLEKGSEEKLFLQGLIQFTAIIYHCINKNWEGANGLSESSLRYLKDLPDSYKGVDIILIKDYIKNLKEDINSFSEHKIPYISYEGAKMELEDLGVKAAFIAAMVISEEIETYDSEVIEEAIYHIEQHIEGKERGKIEKLIVVFVKNSELRDLAYSQIKNRVEMIRNNEEVIEKLFK